MELLDCCRICLTSTADVDSKFSKIFYTEDDNSSIAQLIAECANISVTPTDGLPDIICASCFRSLIVCWKFCTLIKSTDTNLKLLRTEEIQPQVRIERINLNDGEIIIEDIFEGTIDEPLLLEQLEEQIEDFAVPEVKEPASTLDASIVTKRKVKESNSGLDKPVLVAELGQKFDLIFNEIPEPSPAVYASITIKNRAAESEPDEPFLIEELEEEEHLASYNVEEPSPSPLKKIEKKEPNPSYYAYLKTIRASFNKPKPDNELVQLVKDLGEEYDFAFHEVLNSKVLEPPVNEHHCCTCPTKFDKEAELLEHVKTAHHEIREKFAVMKFYEEKTHRCDLCFKVLRKPESVVLHRNRFKLALQCESCGNFILPKGVQCKSIHTCSCYISKNQKIKLEECPICHVTCKNKKTHMSEVHDGKTWKCKLCPTTLHSRCAYTSHMQRHELKKLGKFKCNIPGCDFMLYEPDRKRHMRVHTKETRYVCQYCDKKFTDSTDRRRHEWQHTGVSPYMCSKCNKMFFRKSHLLKHEDGCRYVPIILKKKQNL